MRTPTNFTIYKLPSPSVFQETMKSVIEKTLSEYNSVREQCLTALQEEADTTESNIRQKRIGDNLYYYNNTSGKGFKIYLQFKDNSASFKVDKILNFHTLPL